MFNEVPYITMWIFSVCIFGWAIAPSKHEAEVKKKQFYFFTGTFQIDRKMGRQIKIEII